jgi:hypothetical protein
MCGEPKSLLVIEGAVEGALLEAAWSEIVSEYSSLIQTEKSRSVFEAYKRMVVTQRKMVFMERALSLLRVQYARFEDDPVHRHNAILADQIMLHGYNMITDSDDPETYYRMVDGVEMECKSLVVFFNQYKAEYEAIAPKGESTAEERDRMSYEKELNLLSKHQNHGIDPEAITVLKYASYVNYYLEANKKDSR